MSGVARMGPRELQTAQQVTDGASGLPRGREPACEVGLALPEAPVVEVLGVAERVIVDPTCPEDVRPVVPAGQVDQTEPAPQRC